MTFPSEDTYVLDAFALLAFFQAEAGGPFVRDLLQQAEQGRVRLLMTTVNFGEVIYKTIRERGMDVAEEVLGRLEEFAIETVDVDRRLALAAARLKGMYKVSYADCMAAALAQQANAPVVSGDGDIRQIEGLRIHWNAS
jgi:predicted nucleic acid-binding protein